jgi:hypothetical protein
VAEPTKRIQSIDWDRVGEYLLGRSTLIGIASLMLLVISGYATWHGMRDFIVGVSAAPTDTQGGLSVPNDVLVVIVVAALTFLMWLALRETFGSQRRLTERLITIPLYLFLAVWSIGFGYGFWWSLIAGEEATRTGLLGLQEDARDSSAVIAARLDAVRAQLDNVVTWSESQMSREESSGGSCGTTSGAGRGRLYNARRGVGDSVASLRDGVTRSWLEPMQADLEKLRQSAAQIEGTTVEDRQRRFEARAAEIRGQARNIASRSNELGKSTAQEMRALASAVAIAPGQAGFSCFDPTLSQRLTNAAGQAEVPATLTLREAAFNEGPAGVANAVKKLWENIGSYLAGSVRYLFSGGSAAGTTKGGDPITGRDLIALLATIGIDLGLLALAALNPPPAAAGRRDGLSRSQALLRLPASAVVRQITAAIETAIEHAPGTDLDWARRHFIHHRACSYFVIPNIYSVDPADKDEQLRALAINQLAGVLDDLNLIRVLSSQELKKLAKDETRGSFADLLPLRAQHERERTQPGNGQLGWKEWVVAKAGMTGLSDDENRLRYHGLLSKAQRLLEIAGWSDAARRDAEVYRLVDCDGLTPLLALFSEATLAKGAESIALARAEQQTLEGQLPLRLEDRR